MKSQRSSLGIFQLFGAGDGLRFRCCDRQITSFFMSSAIGLGPSRCLMLGQSFIAGSLPPSPQPVIERRDEWSLLRPLNKGTAASASDTGAVGPVCASVSSSEPVGEPAPVSMFTSAPAGAPATVCASAHVGAFVWHAWVQNDTLWRCNFFRSAKGIILHPEAERKFSKVYVQMTLLVRIAPLRIW